MLLSFDTLLQNMLVNIGTDFPVFSVSLMAIHRDHYEYIYTAQTCSYFASHIEIQATTEKYNLAIVIYKDDQVLEFGYMDKNRTMSLRHTGPSHSGHFDLINTTDVQYPLRTQPTLSNLTSPSGLCALPSKLPNLTFGSKDTSDNEWKTCEEEEEEIEKLEISEEERFYYPKITHRRRQNQQVQ